MKNKIFKKETSNPSNKKQLYQSPIQGLDETEESSIRLIDRFSFNDKNNDNNFNDTNQYQKQQQLQQFQNELKTLQSIISINKTLIDGNVLYLNSKDYSMSQQLIQQNSAKIDNRSKCLIERVNKYLKIVWSCQFKFSQINNNKQDLDKSKRQVEQNISKILRPHDEDIMNQQSKEHSIMQQQKKQQTMVKTFKNDQANQAQREPIITVKVTKINNSNKSNNHQSSFKILRYSPTQRLSNRSFESQIFNRINLSSHSNSRHKQPEAFQNKKPINGKNIIAKQTHREKKYISEKSDLQHFRAYIMNNNDENLIWKTLQTTQSFEQLLKLSQSYG